MDFFEIHAQWQNASTEEEKLSILEPALNQARQEGDAPTEKSILRILNKQNATPSRPKVSISYHRGNGFTEYKLIIGQKDDDPKPAIPWLKYVATGVVISVISGTILYFMFYSS